MPSTTSGPATRLWPISGVIRSMSSRSIRRSSTDSKTWIRNRQLWSKQLSTWLTLSASSRSAEGVETQAQRHALERLGCDQCQGFYFGRPVEPDLFAQRFEVT